MGNIATLAEITSLITDGKHGDCADEFDSGYYFISSKDVRDGKINYEGARQIAKVDFEDTHRRTRLEPDDILITNSGTIGRMAIVREDEKTCRTTFQKSVAIIKPKKHLAEPRFLYYTFLTQVGYLVELSGGTAQKNLLLGDLRRFKVRVPTVGVQKKIAAILSAYDELIENNQRRIALLEKMAEEIYLEWFVRLRFPGHEKVKVIKGIPEGWGFDKASMYFGLAKGKSYAGEELTDDTEHMPFINLKSFNRGGGYREDGLKYYSGRYKPEQMVHQNDVVMAVTDMTQDRAVIGRVARMPDLGEKGAVISLDTVKLVPKSIHKTFLYAYMRYSGFANFIKEFANGANVLHLKPDLITQQKIIIPPKQLQNEFVPMVEPLYAEADLLGMTNRRLEKMRDTLLPRLISGKLSVVNLDIQFPPGMAEEQFR